jgi:predicted PurR-regulated permease PerM
MMSESVRGPSYTMLIGLFLAAAILIVYLLAPVLSPFFLSGIVAYLGQPMVHFLECRKLSRGFGVLTFFLILILFFFVVVVIILPILQAELAALIVVIPDTIEKLRDSFSEPAKTLFGANAATLQSDQLKNMLFANWRELGSLATQVFSKIGQSGQYVLGGFAYLVLVPVITFYLMRDWNKVLRSVMNICPQRFIEELKTVACEVDAVLSEFLRGQLLIMLVLGLFYGIGLQIVGVKYAFLIGCIAGLVSFVPYFGVIVGLLLAVVVGFGQFDHYSEMLKIFGVFGLGQLLESLVLSPLLVGDRIGLHPVWVIFAVMTGGHLFGFSGILLALPVAAITVVLLRHLRLRQLQP